MIVNEFEYQKEGRYFAQCGRHVEELVAEELRELGAEPKDILRGGVHFRAKKEILYRANYCSQLASRILAPLFSFRCTSDKSLYNAGYNFEWEKILGIEDTFAVFAHVSNSLITHSQYAALKLKDAIVDRFRKIVGKRPSIDREDPHVWINLNVQENHAVVSIDTSGGVLHRRGYRMHGGVTPLQETLAAAIIRLSGWKGERPLFDPLCGSGTLLAEALLHICHIPAGFLRPRFGFELLPDYEQKLWQKVKKANDNRIRKLPEGLIAGSDIDLALVQAAHSNLSRIPSGEKIAIVHSDFRQLPGLENSCIVCNLPYGVRQGEKEELKIMYKAFGDFLKHKCKGSIAFILCGDFDLIGSIGLKPSRRIPLFNGPIECRLLKFEIY